MYNCCFPGAAIFFEFKHYKPKKRFTSTKCFGFMELDEIKPGPIVIELWVDCCIRFISKWKISQVCCVFSTTKHKLCLLQFQVQETHRLQEEETAASDKETTLSPSSPDVTQGQLRRHTASTFAPLIAIYTSSRPAILNPGRCHFFPTSEYYEESKRELSQTSVTSGQDWHISYSFFIFVDFVFKCRKLFFVLIQQWYVLTVKPPHL